jgi:hypothetical protein
MVGSGHEAQERLLTVPIAPDLAGLVAVSVVVVVGEIGADGSGLRTRSVSFSWLQMNVRCTAVRP